MLKTSKWSVLEESSTCGRRIFKISVMTLSVEQENQLMQTFAFTVWKTQEGGGCCIEVVRVGRVEMVISEISREEPIKEEFCLFHRNYWWWLENICIDYSK